MRGLREQIPVVIFDGSGGACFVVADVVRQFRKYLDAKKSLLLNATELLKKLQVHSILASAGLLDSTKESPEERTLVVRRWKAVLCRAKNMVKHG